MNKLSLKISCLLFVLSLTQFCVSQTYIQPQVGFAINKVSNENVGTISYPVLEKSSAHSYYIGIGVDQSIRKNIQFSFSIGYEKLFVSTTGLGIIRLSDDIIATDYPPNPVKKVEHNKLILGFGTSFNLFGNLFFNSSINNVQTLSLHFRFNDGEYVLIPRVNEKEFDFKTGLSYLFTENLNLALWYRNVFWQNDYHFSDELDPIQSIGIQIGYRFKVLNRLQRKSKVNCPKL